jgi:heat shock protein HslJ
MAFKRADVFMNQNAILFLIGGIIVAVLLAGCTAPLGTMPPATTPATPSPMTPEVTATEPSSPLSGTWTLISALGGMGTSNVLPGTTITATFAEDGTISGSGGCNNYVASCQSGANTLSIGALITTLKTCDSPAGIMNQEQIYLMNLQAAAKYMITGDILSISDANGKILLTFRKGRDAKDSLPFAGISWELTKYKSSTGSMIGANTHTTVTALFGAAGNITGSAGCNSYAGSYTHRGQNGISVGPLATTLMYCGDPGVMDQETVYLANLQSAASYQVMTDGKLQFMDGNGTPVLVYTS